MRNRIPKRLKNYGMTSERYMALKWTCREYDAMQRRLADMRITLRASGGESGGKSGVGDPTAAAVCRIMDTRECRCTMAIQRAAIAADPMPASAIPDNVCRGKSYAQIQPPCGRASRP